MEYGCPDANREHFGISRHAKEPSGDEANVKGRPKDAAKGVKLVWVKYPGHRRKKP